MLRQAHGHIVVGLKLFAVALFILGFVGLAQAGQTVSFLLNWVAGGDHAPYYYARTAGRFIAERIDLNLLQGRGSSVAAQAVGAGIDQFGLADMTTVLVAIGKGADEVAIMNVYANYPGGILLAEKLGHKIIQRSGW